METVFKEGDKVFCIIHAWGTVIKISKTGSFPILVLFTNNDGDEVTSSFTLDGKYLEYYQPTLSFTEYTLTNFSQERPIELPKVGEEIMVSNDEKTWVMGRFIEYTPQYRCPVGVVRGGSIYSYRYFKRLR